jgi:N-acetylmuramic acid 6-phosphate etherase
MARTRGMPWKRGLSGARPADLCRGRNIGPAPVQDVAELMPTFNRPQDRRILLIAGGRDALLRAVEGAEDQIAQGTRAVAEHAAGARDVLIAVAASGTTPFTLACLEEAKRRAALTISIANNPGTPILTHADHPVLLDTGAEPIAGSTRMKAGTAQRISPNVLPSLLMIQLGRVMTASWLTCRR